MTTKETQQGLERFEIMKTKIPATHFCRTLFVNVNNERLTDEQFRQLVRNTMDIVDTEDK